MKIVVFGGNGQLASELSKWSRHDIILVPSRTCDIRDIDQIGQKIFQIKPQAAINCAALTNQKYCEDHPVETWEVNVKAVANFANQCRKYQVFSVHISSDAALDPVNVYARSKLASEQQGCDLIVRTSYYTDKHWLFGSLSSNQIVDLSTRYEFNPISGHHLVSYLDDLLAIRPTELISIGTDRCLNYFEFGMAIAKVAGYPTSLIKKIDHLIDSSISYPIKRFMSLDTLAKLNFPVISIEDDLKDVFSKNVTLKKD